MSIPKELRFEIDGGKTYPNGKPDWPHWLQLTMNRRDAAQLINDLSARLVVQDKEHISMYLFGKAEQYDEDE